MHCAIRNRHVHFQHLQEPVAEASPVRVRFESATLLDALEWELRAVGIQTSLAMRYYELLC